MIVKRWKKTYIREWRKLRKMTLEKLGDEIDMTASHLSMLERGDRSYTQETIEAIARALRTDVGSLVSRNPTDEDDIWPIWEEASPDARKQIFAVVKALTERK